MAIQIQGNGGTIAEVDGAVFRALRVTMRPADYGSLGHYGLAQVSGALSAALAANAELYQFRWTDATRLAVVRRVVVSGGANVAATTAALVALELAIARGWSADGSGGTAATLTGNNGKFRTAMGTSLAGAARIASTAGLTAGTKTIDTNGVGNVAFSVLTGAITVAVSGTILPSTPLLEDESGNAHPIVLATNEGWIVRNGATAWPAGMTWNFGCYHRWSELTAY